MSNDRSDNNSLSPRQAAALDALRQAAESGDAESQYRLGMLYGNGEGAELDHGLAEQWFSRAAARAMRMPC